MPPPIPLKLSLLGHRRSRSDRRQAKRFIPRQVSPCTLELPGENGPTAAWVHNLSALGVALLTDREYAADTVLQALLVNGPHTYSLRVAITVIRCFRVITGDFYVGARFDRPLDHDELLPFLI